MLTDGLIAAWLFNKDLGESAGEYKDSIGDLVLASADNADHPAASPKIGAGAYAANNTANTTLTCPVVSIDATNGLTIAIWWRAGSLISTTSDKLLEFSQTSELALEYNRSMIAQRVRWGSIFRWQNVSPQNTGWHHSVLVLEPQITVPGPPPVFGNVGNIWLDGVQAERLDTEVVTAFTVENILTLCGSAAFWNGDIDALHIWNRKLSESEIAEVYNGGNGWEYSQVAAVVTNILLGSTVETCRILNSRIVRGPL